MEFPLAKSYEFANKPRKDWIIMEGNPELILMSITTYPFNLFNNLILLF